MASPDMREKKSNGVTRLKVMTHIQTEWKTLTPTKESPRPCDKSDKEDVEKRVRTRAAGRSRCHPPAYKRKNNNEDTEQQECLDRCVLCDDTVTRLALHPREHARSLDVSDDRFHEGVRSNHVSYHFVFTKAACTDLYRNFWSSKML